MEVSSSTSRAVSASQHDTETPSTSGTTVTTSSNDGDGSSMNNALFSGAVIDTLEPVGFGPSLPPAFYPSESHYSKDVRDSKAVRGVCGLYNLGNTCFMNSGLQSLFSCGPLVKFFCETYTETEDNQLSLTSQFYGLLCKAWSGQYSVVHPRKFKDTLGFFHSQFQDYRQHDCQEFLALLLDTLHEQLNVSNSGAMGSDFTRRSPQSLMNVPESSAIALPCTATITTTTASPLLLDSCSAEPVLEKCEDGEKEEVEGAGDNNAVGGLSEQNVTCSSKSNVIYLNKSKLPKTGRHSPKHLELQRPSIGEQTVGPSLSDSSPTSEISFVDSIATSPSSHGEATSHRSPEHVEEEEISSSFPPLQRFTSRSNLDEVTSSDAGTTMVKPSLKRVSSGNSVTASGLVFTSEDSNHSSLSAHSTDSEQSSAFKRLKIDSLEINRNANNNIKDCVSSSSDCKKGEQTKAIMEMKEAIRTNPPGSSAVSTNVSVVQGIGDNIVSSFAEDLRHKEGNLSNAVQRKDKELQFAAALPDLEDFYSKETKTLNTNVLMTEFLHEMTSDSEKFAKVDNRNRPPSKEVNLLQEAVAEEDKAEKVLLSQSFGVKDTNLHGPQTTDPSLPVKAIKSPGPNVLHNSFSNNEVNLVNPGQLSKFAYSLKGDELENDNEIELKPLLSPEVALATSHKLAEEEKNVQMQAYSKFNTTPVRSSNIVADLSTPIKVPDAMDVDEVEADSCDEDEVELASHSTVEECSSVPNCLRHCAPSEVAMANEAWQDYLSRNNSPIVSTFQGQFRSTVVCSECGHVSVTYEPFMYLSLPIPHAMEQQMAVTYISQHGQPIRYLLNLMKTDKIGTAKAKLRELLGSEDLDVSMAEVLDCHISRVLDDNILLKYVNTLNRKIYAFEAISLDSSRMDGVDASPCHQLLNNEESTPLQYDRDLPTTSREELPLVMDSQRSNQSFDSVNVNSPSSRDTLDFSDGDGFELATSGEHAGFSSFYFDNHEEKNDLECQSTSDEPMLRRHGDRKKSSEAGISLLNSENQAEDSGSSSVQDRLGSCHAEDKVSSCSTSGFWTDGCDEKKKHHQRDERSEHNIPVESKTSRTCDSPSPSSHLGSDCATSPCLGSSVSHTIGSGLVNPVSTSSTTDVFTHQRPLSLASAHCVGERECSNPPSRSCPSPETFPSEQQNSSTLLDVAARLEDTTTPGAFFLQHSPAQRDYEFYQDEETPRELMGASESCSSKADPCSFTTDHCGWGNMSSQDNLCPKQGENSLGADVTGGMEWRSCAICLEDLLDAELLTHIMCNGVFCQTCLQMSIKHTADVSAFCCPICLQPASVYDDFVPLATASSSKPKIRTLPMSIAYRHCVRDNTGSESLQLYGHPSLLHMPSVLSGEALYGLVDRLMVTLHDRLVSPPTSYTILLTDGQGLNCSRCPYSCHCVGCEVPRDAEITLQPSDCLTVQVSDTLTGAQLQEMQGIHEDVSMEGLRSSQPTTIMDCFGAFTQSEILDEHNPWFCPQCERNQCAKKTMTVWRYPDNLIIHLKRFVYRDLSSNKVDTKVIFPHSGMDVRGFLAGPSTTGQVYDLHSIVCHFGGASAGHYTCFARHPLSSKWYYYNDETVTPQTPADGEYSSGYVLFYQRKGTEASFTPPHNWSEMDDEIPDDHHVTSDPSMSAAASYTQNNGIGSSSTALVLYQPPSSSSGRPASATHRRTKAEEDDDDYDNERRSSLFDEEALTVHFDMGFPEDPDRDSYPGQEEPDSSTQLHSFENRY